MADEGIIVLSSDDEQSGARRASGDKAEKGRDEMENRKNFENNLQIGQGDGGPRKKLKKETDEERDTKSTDVDQPVEESESFQDFVSTCLKVDKSANMEKIVDSKIRRYYRLLHSEYRLSEQLSTLLIRKAAEVQRSPSNRFMHIKEVVDELQAHRADKTSMKPNKSDRYIRKLCHVLEALQAKIKKLEEKEVDWDDENDSSYLQMQKYRERVVKVHNKIQELEGLPTHIPRCSIAFTGTPFPTVNKAVEKYINSKRQFPDFRDVMDLLEKSYTEEKITISPEELHVQAKKAFQNIGEQLQKQRQYENWEAHSVFLKQEERDPAEDNPDMRTELDKNQEQFKNSIDEIMSLYVVKSEMRKKKDDKIDEKGSGQDESEAENDSGDDEEDDDDNDDDDDDGDDNDNNQDDNDNSRDKGSGEEAGEDDDLKASVSKAEETVDDIVEQMDQENSTPSPGSSEPLFHYCGPVSPPWRSNDETQVTPDTESETEPDSEDGLCNTEVPSSDSKQESPKTTKEKDFDGPSSKPKPTPSSEDIVLLD